jgi:septal ring factor EnvC (AmiA/AmiB activator)
MALDRAAADAAIRDRVAKTLGLETLRDLSAGVEVAAPTLPVTPFRGDLPWPVAGPVIRKSARATVNRAAPTSGVEIAAAEGTSVASVHEGVVAYAEPFSGFGNLVIVDHGSRTFTLYGDLQEMSVKKGDRVERGQTVGVSGYTAQGAAGVYFELRVDGQSVDPLQWLKKR